MVKISALSVALNRISSQIKGHFWPSGELTKVPYNTCYRARPGFKAKLMSVRNFCPSRNFLFVAIDLIQLFECKILRKGAKIGKIFQKQFLVKF